MVSFTCLSIFVICSLCSTARGSFLDLHPQHIPYVLLNHPKLKEECKENANCSTALKDNVCWGYEEGCEEERRFGSKTEHCQTEFFKQNFWEGVDFGYIRERIKEFEQLPICKPKTNEDSLLQCSRYTRYCHGRNLYFNFRKLGVESSRDKYREDLFDPSDIGGSCDLDKDLLKQQSEHKSALQSWYAELENFSQLPFKPMKSRRCDVTINGTVVFMKLDYGGNMFHHFCDFFNLYASQHVNGSWFGRDIQIVMWDTSSSHYFDPFSLTWKVFSDNPVIPLVDWAGKKVCIHDVMFPLLPRMRRGLYYNTYVPAGCVGSNLFRAFSQHVLHRLNISQDGVQEKKGAPLLRVTLLERGKPENENVYRKIRNQKDLVKVLREFRDVKVKVVEYNWREMPFEKQLSITQNSDIFIGMHGAGLAHFMFLPDWALAFELYNCGDANCYNDLARLRGLNYMTWSNGPDNSEPKPSDQHKHHKYGDNPKFWNWWFDPRRFRQLIREAREKVLSHPAYVRAWKERFGDIQSEQSKTEL
uniref:EGF domain-specific O-linked N-acetylglucosamine transferase n=1 Tax=Phallusia mammillata TaxID=59560 RepID=A0A6F9DCU4_9ASCI|nr:EGF domain-specific O-linked N-acetylglucosamine transferase [Phallusia mammillata]